MWLECRPVEWVMYCFACIATLVKFFLKLGVHKLLMYCTCCCHCTRRYCIGCICWFVCSHGGLAEVIYQKVYVQFSWDLSNSWRQQETRLLSEMHRQYCTCMCTMNKTIKLHPGSKRGRAFVASPRRLRPQCGSISHPLWDSSCHWIRICEISW